MSGESSLHRAIFASFEGEWSLSRTFAGSYEGKLTGVSSFTASVTEVGVYHYEESGSLETAAGQQFGSRQRYLYRLRDEMIEVMKQEDGTWQPLHELRFVEDEAGIHATHLHLCGDDRYSAVFRVDLKGSFDVDYTIFGPKKDYSIRSEYRER